MKITVPDSLSDISVKQYKELAEIKFDENSTEWLIDSIAIMCNLNKEDADQLSLPEVERISLIINRLNNEDENNQELQRKITYKDKSYGFHPNLSKLSVGEFADLESYCGDGFLKNLNEILCILYRPIKTEGGDFYTIEKYKGDTFPNHWDDLKMDVVLGAVNFFLSIGVSLTKGLANYLKEEDHQI